MRAISAISLKIVKAKTALNSVPELSEELDITSALPVGAPAEPMDKTAALRYLERTSPETLALSRDWSDILENLRQVEEGLQK